MKSNDIKIETLRCSVFSETHQNGIKILYNPVLQAENIKTLMGSVISRIKPEYEVRTSKLIVDLGELSLESFEVQFNTRLIEVLVQNIIRLSAYSPEKLKLSYVTNRLVEKELSPEFSHYLHSDIYRQACDCLRPTMLQQFKKMWRPDQLQLLIEQLAKKNDSRQARTNYLTNQRITASQLALTALCYLLNHEQGIQWLSKNYPDSDQLRTWAEAISHGEIQPEQALQLLDVQNLPQQQQETIIHRWLLPLWQQPAVRNIISKRFGRDAIIRIETHYKTIFSQSLSSQALQAVSNAGIVLLWPLLPQLFTLLELYDGEKFISNEARWQAVNCLDWLVWEEEKHTGGRFTVCQLLCGIQIDTPLPEFAILTSQQRQQIEAWLSAVSQQLPAWKKLSLNDIRQLFLRRPGELILESQPPQIIVQSESFDLLLRDWPWPMTLALLPWLNQPLTIIWPLNG